MAGARQLRLIKAKGKAKRRSNKEITNTVLSTKAWTLRRSGCVGAVLQFKKIGAMDNQGRDSNLVIADHLSDENELVVCCSKAGEDCIANGCTLHDAVAEALEEDRDCTGLELPVLLALLSENLRVSAMNQGIAVLYGKKLCVVRRQDGSWPFAVVRRKRDGASLCHARHQGPGSCTHAQAARDAADNQQSDASGDDDVIGSLGLAANRRRNTVHSIAERPLVPSQSSQAHHAAVLDAARANPPVHIPAPDRCKSSPSEALSDDSLSCHAGVVEFGDGAAVSSVWSWWCATCRRVCVTDGLDQAVDT